MGKNGEDNYIITKEPLRWFIKVYLTPAQLVQIFIVHGNQKQFPFAVNKKYRYLAIIETILLPIR
jgi:hypothetical protein